MKTHRLVSAFVGVCGLLWAALALPSVAGTHTWTGGSTSGLWSTAANWENNDAPALGESPLHLVFPTNAMRRFATNNFGGLVVDSIVFHGAAYTLAGLGAGTNLTVDTSSDNSFWNIRAYSGSGHTLHYSLHLLLDGNLEFNIATNANVVVRSRISAVTAGSGLRKDGPGSVYLDPIEDNTFDGTTTVVDGTLRLEGSHVGFGGFTVTDVTVPGPLVIGGNSLGQQPRCLIWQANQIADSSPVTVNRNGNLLHADVDDAIGSLTMAGGIVDTSNGKLTLNGDVIIQNPPSGTPSQIHGSLDLGILGRSFTVETNADLYVYAIVSGGTFGNAAAGINKYGPGYMSLASSSNTFGGYLYIAQGTLAFSNEKQLGAHTNGTSVASNAVLALSGINFGPTVNNETLSIASGGTVKAHVDSTWNAPVVLVGGKGNIDVPTNHTFEIGGIIGGAGGFNKTGPGELLLSGFDDNTFTGAACVEDGILSLHKIGLFTNAIAVSGPLVIGTGDNKSPVAVLYGDEEISPTVPVVVNQNGELQLADHDQTIGALAVNGGLVDSGTFGVLKLAGNVTSTNYIPHFGTIDGRLDLGNAPHSISVHNTGSAWLVIPASIIGGPAGTLVKEGGANLDLLSQNSYQGQTLVNQGVLGVFHPNALGSTDAGTIVADGGTLHLSSPINQPSMTVTGETLTLNGYGVNGGGGALAGWGTNTWDGLVILESESVIRIENASHRLTLQRRIEGPAGLVKVGSGKLIFSGVGSPSFNNTYSGTTYVRDGELVLAKHSIFYNTALAGALLVQSGMPGQSPVVRVQGREQFIGTNAVTVTLGGQLHFESPTFNDIGSLAGNGLITFAPGTRVVTGLNGQSSAFTGTLQGGGINDTNLSFQGSGIFTLDCVNTLAGKVEVTGGILRIDSAQPAARVDVKFQGSIGGTGSVSTITMHGGYIKPGSPLGRLRAANCTIAASHALHIDIHGPALGSGHDQFEVDEAPDLSFTQLGTALGNGFNPAMGQTFLILRNNSASPIMKPFLGLAEGGSFYVDNAHRLQISYLGGDGNDVMLTAMASPGQCQGITLGGNRATINGTGSPGATYQVQATMSVADPASWADLGAVTAGPDGLMQFVDGDMSQYPHRFYRFVAP